MRVQTLTGTDLNPHPETLHGQDEKHTHLSYLTLNHSMDKMKMKNYK